jgi:hypothetical protein
MFIKVSCGNVIARVRYKKFEKTSRLSVFLFINAFALRKTRRQKDTKA